METGRLQGSLRELLLLVCSALVLPVVLVAQAPVHISVWEFPRIPDPDDPHDRFSWLRGLLERFEQQHSEARVHLTELSWKNGPDKLKIAVYAGTPPDVTSGTIPVRLIQRGLIDPAGPFLTDEDRRDYTSSALAAFTMRGEVWGWPWCAVGDLLYLNKRLFQERGVPLPEDGQWTWDEFHQAMRGLTHDRDGDGTADVHGFGFCMVPDRTAEYAFLMQGGASVLSPDHSRFTLQDEAGLAAVGRLIELATVEGVTPRDVGGLAARDLWQAFSERETLACAPFGLWAMQGLSRKSAVDFEVAGFPHVPGEPPGAMTAVSGYHVFRQADPVKRRLCHELARFITNGENQRLLARYGQFPTRRSAGDLYPKDPRMRRAARLLAKGRTLPAHPEWGRVDTLIKRTLQLVLLGKEELGPSLKHLAGRVDSILRSAAPPGGPREASSEGKPLEAGPVGGPTAMAAVVLVVLVVLAALASARAGGLGDRSAYGFLAPAFVIFGLFVAWPAFRAVLLAFQDYTPGQVWYQGWVGWANFRNLSVSPEFWVSMRNTLLYTALAVPAQVISALVVASLVHPLGKRGRNFFRAAFYLPGVVSVVVVALVWRWLYDANYGLINKVLLLPSAEGLYQVVRNGLGMLAHPGPVLGGAYALLLVYALTASWSRDDRIVNGVAVVGGVLFLAWAALYTPWQWFAQEAIPWLTSPDFSLYAITFTTILRGPGGALLIYLAALEALPEELHEAARADGAGPLRRWWEITLPLLRPTTLFLLITATIDSFQVFAQVLMLTDGGPGHSSSVLVHHIYTRAFRDLQLGEASAMAMVLFVAIAAVSLVQYWWMSEEYEL